MHICNTCGIGFTSGHCPDHPESETTDLRWDPPVTDEYTIPEWLVAHDFPRDALVVAVQEEYGYREWLWVYPGTEDELRADWNSGLAPTNFFNPSVGDYRGTMIEIADEVEGPDGNDVSNPFGTREDLEKVSWAASRAKLSAHVHTEEDTFLYIHGDVLPVVYACQTRSCPASSPTEG